MSDQRKKYLKSYRKKKLFIRITQLCLALSIIILWEVLAKYEIINSFITSSPSKIVVTIINLFIKDNLIYHIFITLTETIIAFIITLIISITLSILIYRYKIFDKIIDPYLTIFNSLPKVALAPLLIIWVGANYKSIILMAILISIIVSIQSISIGFKNTNESRIKLLKSFKATDKEILKYVVLPSNYKIIINACKINIGLCLIGVIMGEFLTSKAGIGYLILYGSQVFNLNLVMSGIIILLIISLILYNIINIIEKHLDI